MNAQFLSNTDLVHCADRGDRLNAVEFLDSEAERIQLRAKMATFHQKYDLLIVPTLACAPFAVGYDQPPHWKRADGEFMAMVAPFDLTGQPAISVPCGFSAKGGPIGLQIVGPFGSDALVLRAARAFERANPVGRLRPPI